MMSPGIPIAFALAVATPLSGQLSTVATRHDSVAGITYSIDTARDSGPTRGILKQFAGVVVFAKGRGRLDIVAQPPSPPVQVNGITIASPLAAAGDYYLFDSTGFILVRPAANTFSSFGFTDASYNYENRRDGWPDMFEFSPLHADTLGVGAARELLTQHLPVPIYWHLDLGQQTPLFRVLSRGRVTLVDVPAGELSAARWFGPTQALADIPGGLEGLNIAPIGITTVCVLPARGENRSPTNVISLHALSGLRTIYVELPRLVLPAGFTETAWPGYAGSARMPPLSSDRGGKWRVLPGVARAAPPTRSTGSGPALRE